MIIIHIALPHEKNRPCCVYFFAGYKVERWLYRNNLISLDRNEIQFFNKTFPSQPFCHCFCRKLIYQNQKLKSSELLSNRNESKELLFYFACNEQQFRVEILK